MFKPSAPLYVIYDVLLQYDAKLLKLQNQKAKNQQHTSLAAGVTQDIFRKVYISFYLQKGIHHSIFRKVYFILSSERYTSFYLQKGLLHSIFRSGSSLSKVSRQFAQANQPYLISLFSPLWVKIICNSTQQGDPNTYTFPQFSAHVTFWPKSRTALLRWYIDLQLAGQTSVSELVECFTVTYKVFVLIFWCCLNCDITLSKRGKKYKNKKTQT